MANNQQLLLGEGAGGGPVVYVEDVFSAYVYAGSNSSLTITNNIDLSTKGGLVWAKRRDTTANHQLADTVRGAFSLVSNQTAAQGAANIGFTSTGFDTPAGGDFNPSGASMASWTFREQPKFFDIVTYTGDGAASRTIAHNLGSAPGFMVVKSTSQASTWAVYHRSIDVSQYVLALNTTDAQFGQGYWNYTAPTSSVFTVGASGDTNQSGQTYVAYLFAHDAGGFGLAGTDNVISCGTASVTAGTWLDVNVGFEPQWVLLKNSTAGGTYNPSGSAGSEDWFVIDTMRGATAATNSNTATVALSANSSIAEYNDVWFGLTSTGFSFKGVTTGSDSFIYIAIRRGPMKVPTVGTSVFSPTLATVAEGTGAILTTNFPIDLQVMNYTPGTSSNSGFLDRLRGIATTTTQSGQRLISSDTSAEATASVTRSWDNTGFQVSSAFNNTRTIYWNFRRAPGFFDEVCYTGTGANTTFTHNLGVVPELMIVKNRTSGGYGWRTYSATLGATKFLQLNSTAKQQRLLYLLYGITMRGYSRRNSQRNHSVNWHSSG